MKAVLAVAILAIVVASGPVTAEDGYDRQPVSDREFQDWLPFFEYDRESPLNGRTSFSVDLSESVERKKISFRSGNYGRVPGYLSLPKDKSGAPFPVILATHGQGDGITQGKAKGYIRQWMELLSANGYAVLAIDARGYGERGHEIGYRSVREAFSHPADRRDMYIGSVTDWRRGIDYLAGRDDIDVTRLGLLGSSMGTMYGSILAAVEMRIRAVTLVVPGMSKSGGGSPPADVINYIGRISPRPLIMFNGKQDTTLEPEGSKALFKLAGEPKEQHWYDAAHNLTGRLELYQDPLLDFFDRNVKLIR
jgi:fermentation-respiration switch protein FrsA (DUF1100 family)